MTTINRRAFMLTGTVGVAAASACLFGASGCSPVSSASPDLESSPGSKSNILDTPKLMNMGFHYTTQFSRRTRVNVLGLVDHATDEWERWYHQAHEREFVQKIAGAGYKIIEVHFMQGFGIEGEKREYELTRKMVAHAHEAGLTVFGYLQFFSVQKELFFLENPWARDCPQLDHNGAPIVYNYDRPALCFTHEAVRQYYLDAVEIGLTYCDLDGIRLDNDYFRGCYCAHCQREFTAYLKARFSPAEARRVFGLETTDGMEFVPEDRSNAASITDPLYLEMVTFRMVQRQRMMALLREKIDAVKPGAILGGNPAISRHPNDAAGRHVYIPDLGKTHHLVCAENSLFPARTGDSIRHQVVAYKYGQSCNFKVFPSHHLYTPEGKTRWPETMEECALSLCEALAFGGHVPCTTWGMRMDGAADKTLYERAHFLEALAPVRDFLRDHDSIYKKNASSAKIGIYVNRETQIADVAAYWYSFQGFVQLMLRHKIPFRFVDGDTDDTLADIDVLLVGNIRLVSDAQLERIRQFAKTKKAIITGQSFHFDEHLLRRDPSAFAELLASENVIHLPRMPERVSSKSVEYHAGNYHFLPLPTRGDEFMKHLLQVHTPPVTVVGSPFIAIDTFTNDQGEEFIHLLNYDNTSPRDVDVAFGREVNAEVLSPGALGCAASDVTHGNGKTQVRLKNLHTYAVIKAM